MTQTLTTEIHAFIDEWVGGLLDARKEGLRQIYKERDYVTLNTQEPGNYVPRVGYRRLMNAARELLRANKLTQKVQLTTAIDALTTAHFELLPGARSRKKFSETLIASRALELVKAAPRASGLYVYPLIFAKRAKKTDWGFGPVRILAKDVFRAKYRDAFEAEQGAADNPLRPRLLADWEKHAQRYDHFILVEVKDHEKELAEELGREAAEFFLNLIRMLFGYLGTEELRIGGGFVIEPLRSALYFDDRGEANFTTITEFIGTSLDDTWTESIDRSLGQMLPMFGSYLDWFLGGKEPANPILERIRYATTLIAEAYAEPHDHIRLVRLVSALEAFALAGRGPKADGIALHCSLIGGRGDPHKACGIYDAVQAAYVVRSAIVHGDRPSAIEIRQAFLGLERYALDIVVAFVNFFLNVQGFDKPQSVAQLRRIVRRGAIFYYWMPEIAFT
jgi:hypothetical protein